ncbi:MAG TPA: DUF4249 domain-containing protein, partial [Anditalea sp.]|nr:DUF4249 domain-containing protein [Anditalea sp.]
MKNIIYLIILVPIFLSSCMDVVDMKLDKSEIMVVVDGEINDQDELQTLRLSLSQPYFQDGSKVTIDNAQVILFEDGQEVGNYEFINPGLYSLNYSGQIGKKYHVSIMLPTIPENPSFSGKQITSEPELLAPVSDITDIFYEFREEGLIYEEGYYVSIDTYDPKGKGNFYRWKLKVNGEFSKDPKRFLLLDDDRVDGNLIENLDLTFDPYKAGDVVTVRQQSISQNFYKYLMDVYMQALTQENFFDSPSFNPISNLK